MKVKPPLISLALGAFAALATLWLLAWLTPTVQGQGPDGHDTYYVAPSCDGVPEPCFTAVQSAVDAADDPGDTVKVATGVYTGVAARSAPPGYDGSSVVTQVVYISKTVTVRGGYTTTNWTTPDPEANRTTLDAQGQGRVLFIAGDPSAGSGQTISPTIEGFWITGGDATGLGDEAGGGLYLITATATISNNWVFSNTAFSGGGLYLRSSNATLSGNTISVNTADHSGGGVVLAFASNAMLTGNTITSNTTSYSGGGLLVMDDCDATIEGNTVTYNAVQDPGIGNSGGLALVRNNATLSRNLIAHNRADEGGGVGLFGGSNTLTNNIIVDNQAIGAGSGLYIDRAFPRLLHTTIARNTGGSSGIYLSCMPDPSSVVLTNTILASHTVGIIVAQGSTATLEATLWGGGTWANDADWGGAGHITIGTVNIWGNPAFMNPNGGDYHIGPGSAARDAGTHTEVNFDIDGELRSLGPGPDIGADELAGCEAYPIAVHESTLENANVGDILPDLWNGWRAGNFGWLRWSEATSGGHAGYLVEALRNPALSLYDFDNALDPDDHSLNADDWVWANMGVISASDMRDALDALVGAIVRIAVWDEAQVLGVNGIYHVERFVLASLTDYNLNHGWIRLTYMGEVEDPESCRAFGLSLASDGTQMGLPGQGVRYDHKLTNEGNYTETAVLAYITAPAGWLVSLNPISQTLAPRQAVTVTAVVTIPVDSPAGITNVTHITAALWVKNAILATVVDTTTVSDVPVAGLEASNDSPTELGQVTTLTATITAGSHVTYAWAFGDAEAGSGAVVTHTYPAVGVYTAVVTASNDAGVIRATTAVTITEPDFFIYLPLILCTYPGQSGP